jgi:hypothetical protein
VQKILASDGFFFHGFGRQVAIEGDIMIIKGGPAVYSFTFDGTAWNEFDKATPLEGDSFYHFTGAYPLPIALDGDTSDPNRTAVIGAWDNNINWPAFYAYRADVAHKLFPEDPFARGPIDRFGVSIAVENNTIMVGADSAFGDGVTNTGAVFVYTFDGTNWNYVQKLLASDRITDGLFGASIAIDGNTALIGALAQDRTNDNGAVYVFNFDGTKWNEVQKLTTSGTTSLFDSGFGRNVAIDGNTAIVSDGTLRDTPVYIFTFDGTNWSEAQKLRPEDVGATSAFGDTIAIEGGTAIVGDWGSQTGVAGSAYVYTRGPGGSWSYSANLQASDYVSGDGIPSSVGLSDGTVILGASGDDDNGDNSGSAYVYSLNFTRFKDVPTDYWAREFIEILADSGITAGCGNDNYCPEDTVTRAQMAVFLERGMRGSDFVPPPAAGNVFLDVGADDFAASYIEQLFADGITGGCGSNNYCPNNPVTRAQMAVFMLRAIDASCPAPSGDLPVFLDVPEGSFAKEFIECFADLGISSGCGGGNFCPDDPVTRAQMAVFLVRAFGL